MTASRAGSYRPCATCPSRTIWRGWPRSANCVLGELGPMSAADFHRAPARAEADVSASWVVFHLIDHEVEHRVRISAIRDAARRPSRRTRSSPVSSENDQRSDTWPFADVEDSSASIRQRAAIVGRGRRAQGDDVVVAGEDVVDFPLDVVGAELGHRRRQLGLAAIRSARPMMRQTTSSATRLAAPSMSPLAIASFISRTTVALGCSDMLDPPPPAGAAVIVAHRVDAGSIQVEGTPRPAAGPLST